MANIHTSPCEMDTVNKYGDRKTVPADQHGIDIANQRGDNLDRMALDRIRVLARERRPFALDVTCGAGGQALRMAMAGARVLAFDIAPLEEVFRESLHEASENASNGPLDVEFCQWDMRELPSSPAGSLEEKADVIVCQRAVHYLPFDEALRAVSAMGRCLAPGGEPHLSASGMGSELSSGYAAKDIPLSQRFAPLSRK